jgi:type IV secretory pathway TrbF-like protein
MFKPTLIALSVLCLSFMFARDYFENTASHANENAAANNMAAAIPASPLSAEKSALVSDVVSKALAFEALLSSSQQASLQLTYSTSLARKWSNLPCGASCRNGIQLGTLSSAQLAAALDVIKAALGTNANDGYDEFLQNRLAEAYLHANGGGSGYDSTLRWIAFLNAPSATGAWMLQFGGHHYAANIAFNNGHVVGATPFFQGLEPLSFNWNGTTYAPLNDEHDALTAMLASLSSSDLATARLSSTFSDCVMVPGETNGGTAVFPSKAGLLCSTLTATQKSLVLAAIQHYVRDMDSVTANAVMQRYTNEIDGTYIAYTGSGTSGTASSFLNSNSNYVRIDGPTVWIELACQNGVVFSGQIHYHTVWRDHSHDYGLDLSGTAIDTASSGGSTAVAGVSKTIFVSVFPNPAGDYINIALPARLKAAAVKVVALGTGQTVISRSNYSGPAVGLDVSQLRAGMYTVRIEDESNVYFGKFGKL